MDLTFEQWVNIIKEFLKGRNTYEVSVSQGVLEDDMIDFEEIFLNIKTLEDAEKVFGDTLIVVADHMLHDGHGVEFIPEHISNTFKISEEVVKELIIFENLSKLYDSWHQN